MLSGKHPVQRIAADVPPKTECRCTGALPLTIRLRPAEVVVLDAQAHRTRMRNRRMGLIEVVAGLAGGELAEREHRDLLFRPLRSPFGPSSFPRCQRNDRVAVRAMDRGRRSA